MKKQIVKHNAQGEVISVSEYGMDRPDTLVCPKCQQPKDMLLGDGDSQACEICYVEPVNPPERNEAVMPVGDEDQIGQLRGTAPKQMTAEELLSSLGVKKNA